MKTSVLTSSFALAAAVGSFAFQAANAQVESPAPAVIVVADGHLAGLRILGAASSTVDGHFTIDTRLTRSLATRVLAPVILEVSIKDAAGTVKSTQQTRIGPAQLPRRQSGDASVANSFEQPPVAGDTIEIRLRRS